MELDYPNNVYDIIQQTFQEKEKNPTMEYHNCLLMTLKKYHMWPYLQVKKFKNNDFLVLLHNSYDIKNVDEKFRDIYNQCRSIVLDFSLDLNNNIVVSYANNIPIRVDFNDYCQQVEENDRFQEAYDGTTITIYNYKNDWYFGSSTCTDINMSKFSHPTKTHGDMFNEVLMNMFSSEFTPEELAISDKKYIEKKLRDMFVSFLDKSIAYEFVLIHCENNHIIDYSDVFGQEYKILYHINSKNRENLCECDISNQPLTNISCIKYPTYFTSLNDAYNYINTNKSYGFIVKKNTETGVKLFKISPQDIVLKEETDPCKPNIWHNFITIYMKNRKDFKIVDYIEMYKPQFVLPKDEKDREIDPTYIIHTVILTIKDILYNSYIASTTYNTKTNRFKMNKELDMQFPPIIRFHLAQLRHRQQNIHVGKMIQPSDVYHYICQCNNLKNIKLLIHFLASNSCYNLKERTAMCITTLGNLI